MSTTSASFSRQNRLLDRHYAWRSRNKAAGHGFARAPEPRTIGNAVRGQELVQGNLLFAGYLVTSDDTDLWDVAAPDAAFEQERQGFDWLDDLAAVGGFRARQKAQRWLKVWIDLYGRGSGPGWTPELTGRRMIRWINNALFLLHGMRAEERERFHAALSRQAWFLSKRWKAARPGVQRIEALCGLIYAALSLEGHAQLADLAVPALASECNTRIDRSGGLPSRRPEELLEVLVLLNWAAAALLEAGRGTPPALHEAIERIAPTLRALAHGDGSLARFHGGGRGLEGQLEHALADAGGKRRVHEGLAMGYARLAAGRTTVIVDAAPPPTGAAAVEAHASTLAFELTSARRPLIVNAGSGTSFGPDWRRAGRATAAHSTLCLNGTSSAGLSAPDPDTGLEALTGGPRDVPTEIARATGSTRFDGGHEGYVPSYGLTHARSLELFNDGRTLEAEDMLFAVDKANEARFRAAGGGREGVGVPVDIHFHLHPDVVPEVDEYAGSAELKLPNGEVWLFTHDRHFALSVQPGYYLERGRLEPRATKQVVLSGRASEYATRVRWVLAKSAETAVAVRDVDREDAETGE
ncbi:heparinase II/III family protein [Chachezhania sediminis]|uniref:heparinase II/III family protein n=1 Tax=Chachezhania sediminis TaxID=2599291 RepID=UPI00131E3124|nr:heparinase II/III family protein [Chachezhania sediminis]